MTIIGKQRNDNGTFDWLPEILAKLVVFSILEQLYMKSPEISLSL